MTLLYINYIVLLEVIKLRFPLYNSLKFENISLKVFMVLN